MTKRKKQADLIREQPMSYDEYAALPEDGNRYELVEGILEMMSPGATARHQMMSFEMQSRLAQTCKLEYVILYAPIDVILSNREVRQPDLVMIHRSRLEIITKRGIEGAPDLVIEILSPHSIRRDKVGKRRSYAKYGIPEYWVIDPPNEALEQYILNGDVYELAEVYIGDELVQSEHIPCIAFTMQDIMGSIPELPNA
ncbi:MAG: Uma2 family endonuclease [Paenibacillaceae bacterium]